LTTEPQSLPGVVSGVTQQNFDALNGRVHGVETGEGIQAGAITNEKLAKPPIAGAVSAEGAVTAGSGFTSERTATGVYKITLTTELATVGVLIPASQLVGAEIYAASGPAKKVFEVKSFSTALVAKNMNFNFVIHPT